MKRILEIPGRCGQYTDGFICFTLKSNQPLQATQSRLDTPHRLVVKLALRSDIPSEYTLESEEMEVDIEVQVLRLRLWVVPGVFRNTSEALAYLDMLPAREALLARISASAPQPRPAWRWTLMDVQPPGNF